MLPSADLCTSANIEHEHECANILDAFNIEMELPKQTLPSSSIFLITESDCFTQLKHNKTYSTMKNSTKSTLAMPFKWD